MADAAPPYVVHDIVQAVPGKTNWAPALVVVTEVRSWGIVGYTAIPCGGLAFIRLNFDEIEPTGGRAVFVREVSTDGE